MRRPLAGQKRDKEESDREKHPNQHTPKKSNSCIRAGSSLDTPPTSEESYDENVSKLHAELELEKPNEGH